ncbi:MAG: hypothetical protein Q7J68_06750 [Thermoplasmata archaeon]|nr:hypothetical protein [Thermoplasmata archaeon]
MGLGIILLASMFSPLAMGENDSLHVIMTVEDRNYSVGDTVNVQLRVYNLGALTDVASASDMYLGVSTNHNFNNPINLTLTSSGTGIYTASYTVKAADNNRQLYFFYEITLGNDHEEGDIDIRVYSIPDTVDVNIAGQDTVPAHPGDIITATILTRTGSTLIPITGFTNLYVESPTGQRQNYTTYTTEQDGIYSIEFTVPQVSVSGTYEIFAQPMGMGDHDSAMIHVNVLDVWCHKVATAGNTVSFEVCVADLLGAPVEGANFVLERIDSGDNYYGTTNASGKDLVHVPDITGTVYFGGYVLASGLNQTISGTVYNQVAEMPDHNDFDIMWEGTETIFEPDTDVTIPYGAYDSRLPAASKVIYYYVTATGTDFDMFFGTGNHIDAAREVISAGVATTDVQGKFSLAFKTPEDQCAIHVRLEVPLDYADYPANEDHDIDNDKYYDVWPQNNWNTEGFEFYAYEGNLDGDKEVGISGGSFSAGKIGTVTVELSAGTGDPVIAFWIIGEGNLETGEFNDLEWMRWVPSGYLLRLEQTESGKYTASFLVPEFIEDQDVTVISGYMDTADGTPHFDSKTISPGGGFNWLWVIVIIIIIVVVIVLVIVIRDRF